MKKDPLVSIVICSHDRSADVSDCLGAVIPQIGAQAEVILVDSASDPKNKAEMAKLAVLYPAVKLTRVDQPGHSRARNRGVHLAGKVISRDFRRVSDPSRHWRGNISAMAERHERRAPQQALENVPLSG
jgi:glycosyltransferase involved in cell wall biosynthesis